MTDSNVKTLQGRVTISQAVEAKSKLERDIFDLLEEFMGSTGLEITDIQLQWLAIPVTVNGGDEEVRIRGVRVAVEV